MPDQPAEISELPLPDDTEKLRAQAAKRERDQDQAISEAHDLLLQMRALMSEKKVAVPAKIDRALFGWFQQRVNGNG